MNLKKIIISGIILANTSLFAQGITLEGTQSKRLHLHGNTSLLQSSPEKTIKFLNIKLSPSAMKSLKKKSEKVMAQAGMLTKAPNLPTKVQLGMNGVPVLDQGSHGSCVTFAATGAIDAIIESDYVSQLCQLQLGNYLEKNSNISSGWDGSLGHWVLSQMEIFGVVNKQRESQGCGGYTQYPLEGIAPETFINAEDYHQISESLDDHNVSWSSILNINDAVLDRMDTNQTLSNVKIALAKGNRVVFGTLLPDVDLGLAGAVGTKNRKNDTWVLTQSILRDLYLRPLFAGHEMIITGYDDNATAQDEDGNSYKGLLTLRNSWGDSLGDKGDFYMSYDYFKTLVIEAAQIRNIPDADEFESTH